MKTSISSIFIVLLVSAIISGCYTQIGLKREKVSEVSPDADTLGYNEPPPTVYVPVPVPEPYPVPVYLPPAASISNPAAATPSAPQTPIRDSGTTRGNSSDHPDTSSHDRSAVSTRR